VSGVGNRQPPRQHHDRSIWPAYRLTQTDGMFKNGDAANFPWLKADGTPTVGDSKMVAIG
jgi:hypothetical protein